MKASAYGIKNLKYIIKNLPEWTKEEVDQNENIDEMYAQLVGQYRRYTGHVTANVGGVYENIRTSMEATPVYEVTPKSRQKEAVAFLQANVFETPNWLLSKEILNRINNPGETNPVVTAQESALNSLISTDRLNRMQESTERFGAQKAYSAMELLDDVQNGLFQELKSKKPIDSYRRRLQKSYVEKLSGMVNGSQGMAISVNRAGGLSFSNVGNSDLSAIARMQLVDLQKQVALASAGTTDKMSRIHLIDLRERIKDALDPKK
jgi:hypothetical protein